MFGSFERQLDDRGRVRVPAAYAAAIGTDIVLMPNEIGIEILPIRLFDRLTQEWLGSNPQQFDPARIRAIALSVVRDQVRSQDRILIPAFLRSRVGITAPSTVVIRGLLDRAEICPLHVTLGSHLPAVDQPLLPEAPRKDHPTEGPIPLDTVQVLRALETRLQSLNQLMLEHPADPAAMDEIRVALARINHEVRQDRPALVILKVCLGAIASIALNIIATALWEEWGQETLQFIREHL